MTYIACYVIAWNAHIADPDEIAQVRWCADSEITANDRRDGLGAHRPDSLTPRDYKMNELLPRRV
jgi:hypothetical protein